MYLRKKYDCSTRNFNYSDKPYFEKIKRSEGILSKNLEYFVEFEAYFITVTLVLPDVMVTSMVHGCRLC